MKVAPGALVDKKFPFLPIRIQGRYINFQENSQYLKNMNTMKFKQLQASPSAIIQPRTPKTIPSEHNPSMTEHIFYVGVRQI